MSSQTTKTATYLYRSTGLTVPLTLQMHVNGIKTHGMRRQAQTRTVAVLPYALQLYPVWSC